MALGRTTRLLALCILVVAAVTLLHIRTPHVDSSRSANQSGAAMVDFEVPYAAGKLFGRGDDPYSSSIWDAEKVLPGKDPTREAVMPYAGPPFFLPLWGLIARLSYADAAALWIVVMLVSACTIVAGCWRLAGGSLSPGNVLSLVLFGIAFMPLSIGVILGQETLPAFAAAVVAMSIGGMRPRVAAAVSTLVVALKPTIAFAMIPLARRRAWCAVFAADIVVLLGGSLIVAGGLHGLASYSAVIRDQGAAERLSILQFAPLSVLYGLGLSVRGAEAIAALVALAAVCLTAWRIAVVSPSLVDSVALAAAALPFVFSYFHWQDLIVTLLPAMIIFRRARGVVWLTGTAGALFAAGGWVAFAFARGSAPLLYGVLALFAVASLASIALSDPRVGKLRLAPLGLIPLAAVFAWVTVGHMATPATLLSLPAGFSVPGVHTASAVWSAELQAIGYDRQDPWGAALRAMALAGAALIYIATFAIVRVAPDTERLRA